MRKQVPRRASMLAVAVRMGKRTPRKKLGARSRSLSCGGRLSYKHKARIHRRPCLNTFALLSAIKRLTMTRCLKQSPILPFGPRRTITNVTNSNDQFQNFHSDATCKLNLSRCGTHGQSQILRGDALQILRVRGRTRPMCGEEACTL